MDRSTGFRPETDLFRSDLDEEEEAAALLLAEKERAVGSLHALLEKNLSHLQAQTVVLRRLLRCGRPQTVEAGLEMLSRLIEEANADIRAFLSRLNPRTDGGGISGGEGMRPEPPVNLLTRRQTELLSLIAKGCTYKEAADRLFISERTAKYEMARILKSLRLQSRREAVLLARKCGWIRA